MEVIRLLGNEGIDLIEISGGTYEKPAMIQGDRKKVPLRVKRTF